MQDSINDNENVVAEHDDGTRLVQNDDTGGSVIESYPDPDAPDGRAAHRVEYDRWKDAKLHFGLWRRLDGFERDRPDRSATKFVPVEVIRHGKSAIAAWIRTAGGRGLSTPAETIADKMGVQETSVYNYLSEARCWAGFETVEEVREANEQE